MGYSIGIEWQPHEDDFLKSVWGKLPANKIGRELGGRSKCSVLGRAHRLNLPSMREQWPLLKIERKSNGGLRALKLWPDERVAQLREIWGTMSSTEISERLFGTPKRQQLVIKRAQLLGLGRGLPPGPRPSRKLAKSVRLDPEVVAAFCGPGFSARINAVLKSYIQVRETDA